MKSGTETKAKKELHQIQMRASYYRGLEDDAAMPLVSSKEEQTLAYVSSRPEHRDFPVTEWEGLWVPEARSYPQHLLPHQVCNNERVFPTAEVSEEPKDEANEKRR